ncbi:MAG: FAD:protein FMN transferase [Oscillospiraceae bacterium]|nr:FAD:protein FMN transferase [Oscillospiraceae bacterium]
MKKKQALKCAPALLALLVLCGCTAQANTPTLSPPEASEPHETAFFAMDTLMQMKAYGAHAADGLQAAEAEIYRLEQIFSHTLEESDISAVNAAGGAPVTVSEETASLTARALDICATTDGALDLTVYPLVAAYGFPTGNYTVLSAEERLDLLASVDYEAVTVDASASTMTLEQPDMGLSLGSVAKGYASQQAADLLRGYGIDSALLTLGGNIQAVGAKPDGSPWKVAVQDPFTDSGYVGVLSVTDCAVITSGGYQRFFDVEEDGKTVRYHHILDPDTGLPADSGLSSVTIVTDDGFLGDALSTSLFVMGLDEATEYWRAQGGFEAVFVTDDGAVYITEGLCALYEPSEGFEQVQTIAMQSY